MTRSWPTLWLLLGLALTGRAAADPAPAPFDLAGPALRVQVVHAGTTLSISEVPNLTPGDQLSIRADLPPSQSVHYLLVAAFLRGATNPPPQSWFYRAETWNRNGRDVIHATVPADAEQVIVFLAPDTGGDFRALIGAVRGRPGAFVRASQDLNQASLDRSRLDAFLAAVARGDSGDPERLKTVSPLLARSLTIKLNTDCFQKMAELQAACLMQGRDALVLSDGHSTSIVEALTSGATADLAMQLGATPQAGFGYYSPYIGAALDIARILDSFRTAQYQYIPALATEEDDRIALLLNTAPSFHNPLSVLVAALPAVEAPQAPPLQPVDPKAVFCAQGGDELVLPMDGAPLAYSTHYAHDMVLRVTTRAGHTIDLPVHADAEKGGFVTDRTRLKDGDFGQAIDGAIHGLWGFMPFEGPSFHLQNAEAGHWRVVEDDQASLIAGRNDTIRLQGAASACVQDISLKPPEDQAKVVGWKPQGPDRLAVTVGLADAQPRSQTLLIRSSGLAEPDAVPVQVFAQAARLDSFTLYVGDAAGVLKGSRLDEVDGLTLHTVGFKPGALTSTGGHDELAMTPADPQALAGLKPGQDTTARVTLKDGRSFRLAVAVAPPRPQATLIGESVERAPLPGAVALRLGDPSELPHSAQLTFSIRATAPMRFSGQESIEIATPDGGASTVLTTASGLTVADASVALATLDAAKAFGPSTFGPLQFRVVKDGAAGDWRPLATLVRLPTLRELKCGAGHTCELVGANLFLIDLVSADAGFEHPTKVPDGFPGDTLAVPRPAAGRLYVKLHDDPTVINQAAFTAKPAG